MRRPDIEKEIGFLIRLRRKACGISQHALGELIGVSYQQIQKYETGVNRVAVSTAAAIARALNCHVLDLIPKAVLASSAPTPLTPEDPAA